MFDGAINAFLNSNNIGSLIQKAAPMAMQSPPPAPAAQAPQWQPPAQPQPAPQWQAPAPQQPNSQAVQMIASLLGQLMQGQQPQPQPQYNQRNYAPAPQQNTWQGGNYWQQNNQMNRR